MKKILFYIIIIFFILSLSPAQAFCEEEDSALNLYEQILHDSKINLLDFEDEEGVLFTLTGYHTVSDLLKAIIGGDYSFNFSEFIKIISSLFFSGIKDSIKTLLELLLVTIIFELLMNAGSSFLNETVKNAVYYSIFIILVAILSKLFFQAIQISSNLITSLVSFFNLLLPVLLILLASSGGVLTSALLSPTLLLLTNAITYIITNVILPAASFCFVISLADKLTESINLSYLCDFIKKTSYFIIGALFTIFTFVAGFEGMTTVSLDSASINVVKYAASTLIPVVGKFLSESANTVSSFLAVIKNSVGLVGVIVILIISLIPVIKLFVFYITMRFASIIIQPFADVKIASAIDAAASCMLFVMICVITVSVMFIIISAILVNFGNALYMMRF